MKRLMSLLAISLISTNVGCALCSSCDDYSYGAFGGLWERADQTNGRVGSAFSPAGFSTSEVVPADADAPEVAEPQELDEPAPETLAPTPEDALPGAEMDDDSALET